MKLQEQLEWAIVKAVERAQVNLAAARKVLGR